MQLTTTLHGRSFQFRDVKDVLAKASARKSGDELAGIAAGSNTERVAAKVVLGELTLEDLRAHPVVPHDKDQVTRVIDEAVDEEVYQEIKGWSVGKLREWILSHETPGEEIVRRGGALTGEMAAAVAKLMDAYDLIYAAKKIAVASRAHTTLGLPGTLASRLQPNHPSDSTEGIAASIYEGLSYGCGDALIGINPNEDSVENTVRLLELSHGIIDRWEVPTQNCVLAYVTTQMKALERGAPMDVLFQSIAGTEAANRHFGISVSLLDEAHEMIKQKGHAKGPNLMYFETGQGSEVSLESHHGADQMTLEARTYGLARRYRPFMVNNVSGFIGPETLYDGKQIIRANLEDHFMGKLLGLPMGMAPCYTNHAVADQDDQSIAIMLLTIAGANYYMAVPGNDDVMLSYQDTSCHDIATLRELFRLRPAPEFEAWLIRLGLMREGRLTPRAGDASFFLGKT